jgi:hypothetical protein
MKVVAANPCDAIERPRAVQSTPSGFSGGQIRRLLDVLPLPVGLRDRGSSWRSSSPAGAAPRCWA